MSRYATSWLASTLRGWRGRTAAVNTRQPSLMLQLYEYEACPFCRLVREALTELDLDVVVLPCPRNGTRFRPQAERVGGRRQFPLLVDDNHNRVLYESADIIAYLRSTYGPGPTGEQAMPGRAAGAGSGLASLARGMAGARAATRTNETPPAALPELYSYEASPPARRVREVLCELEVPYVLRNTAYPPGSRGAGDNDEIVGRNRQRLHDETGRMDVPCLVDGNTDTTLFEPEAIVAYLRHTYG